MQALAARWHGAYLGQAKLGRLLSNGLRCGFAFFRDAGKVKASAICSKLDISAFLPQDLP